MGQNHRKHLCPQAYNGELGYCFMREANKHQVGIHLGSNNKALWKGIWSLNTPNKVKNMIGRTCQKGIPTKVNLVRRTTICDLCKLTFKDTLHALWSYPQLDIMWEANLIWNFRLTHSFEKFKAVIDHVLTGNRIPRLFATQV